MFQEEKKNERNVFLYHRRGLNPFDLLILFPVLIFECFFFSIFYDPSFIIVALQAVFRVKTSLLSDYLMQLALIAEKRKKGTHKRILDSMPLVSDFFSISKLRKVMDFCLLLHFFLFYTNNETINF